MHSFTCHVTLQRDGVVRIVDVKAANLAEARTAALRGLRGSVSCRYSERADSASRAVEAGRRFGDAL